MGVYAERGEGEGDGERREGVDTQRGETEREMGGGGAVRGEGEREKRWGKCVEGGVGGEETDTERERETLRGERERGQVT